MLNISQIGVLHNNRYIYLCIIPYRNFGRDMLYYNCKGDKGAINKEKHGITISKNAIKNKSAMFVDMPGGSVKQVDYIIAGKAEFDKGDYSGWSTQYIDLWVTILTVVDTVF